ncbi:hypothetical protein Hsar01_03608 [Haloferula sargassicola]|uniref:SHSP domain-containing protein n=2 Tax=Haloferula sargassicola TaxID=490096 RepID=A0ABP9UWC8_9BACT
MNTRGWIHDFSQFVDQAIRQFESPARPFRLYEDEGGWALEMDVPGVAKDDLKLEVRDRALRVELGESGTRELPLGRQIDATAVSAKLTDGVLRIRLPKADSSSDVRRIEIL